MKKLLIIIFLFVLIIIGMGSYKENNKPTNNELRGVFISYIEEGNYLNTTEKEAKKNIRKIIAEVKKLEFNLIILQVRSFSDAIYPSKIYPWSKVLTGTEGANYPFDPLNYFISEAHKNNIFLYTWLNPYRIRTTEDISSISEKNPAYKYLNTDTIYVGNGIYYNPSKKEVEDLIIDGIEEILTNYKVDGILFDDYFYPNSSLDYGDYLNYLENNNFIELDKYHLMIINQMVERVHSLCNKYKVPFGISPDGNINNNYNSIYADIYTWLSSDKYVDFIMPQIYYGLFNESLPFYTTVNEWDSYIKNDSIDLIVALALYKSGNYDQYAKSGSEEWIKNKDIIMREVLLSRNLKHYRGFSLFRYDNLFQNDQLSNEVTNLVKILK